MRFPTFAQWKKLPRVLSRTEKILFLLFAVGLLLSTLTLGTTTYLASTHVVPARGGELVEGMVGNPRFLNPLYSEGNDVDRDLVQLVFAGIAKYNEKREIVPDLAQSISLQEGGKIVEILLEDKLKWQDGTPLTTDDIIFTVETLQDPRYRSPLRANWVGVELEKITSRKLLFKLPEPYAPFLERLTLKIIPAHIWKTVSPENFSLSPYNLRPVGSGPFLVEEFMRDRSGAIKEIRLARNSRYHGKQPFLNSLVFRFFENEEQLLAAAKKGELHSFSQTVLKRKGLSSPSTATTHIFSFPRYFAVFFNLGGERRDDPLKKKDIRKGLEKAIDREALTKTLFGEHGKPLSSLLLPDIFGFSLVPSLPNPDAEASLALFAKQGYKREDGRLVKANQTGGIQQDLEPGSTGEAVQKLQECLAKDREVYPEGTVSGKYGDLTRQAVNRFQEKYAAEILAPNNLSKPTGRVGSATREKINQLCFPQAHELSQFTVSLTTVDQSPLREVAEILKQQWEALGIGVELKLQSAADLERETLKQRNYQALLFGEMLGIIPDPFPFWHSSQKKDPGLNLSSYENKNADKLVEQIRKELDEQKRISLLEELQQLLTEEVPAIPLFDIPYLYGTSPKVQGIKGSIIGDPSWRFGNVSEWYIKTKRAFWRR